MAKKNKKKRAKAKTVKKKPVKSSVKKAPQKPAKTKKTFNHIASLVLGIIALVLFLAFLIIALVGQDTDFTYLVIGALVIVDLFIALLGLGLGIADVFNKKSIKKPVWGIVINSIILFLIVFLIVLGLIVETLGI